MSSDATKLEIVLAAKDATAQAFGTVRSGIRGVENAVFSLKGALAGLGVGYAVKDLFDAGIESQKLSVSFEAITGSAAAASKEFDFLRGVSRDMSTEFYSTADAYKDILAASKGTALEGAGTRDVFLGIAEASRVLSMSAFETQGALKAVRDMMSKGTIMAEELKGQLGDRLPGAVNIVAESFHATTEELFKMMENGELLAEDVLPRLATALHDKYGKAAREANNTALASLNRVTTGWKDFKIEVAENGFLDVAVDVLGDVTAQLEQWSSWVSAHEADVKDFFQNIGETAKIMGTSVAWGVGAAGDAIRNFAYSARGAGLASAGVISWSDYILSGPEELRKIVNDFDLDPLISKLESQKGELSLAISGLEAQVAKGNRGKGLLNFFEPDYMPGIEKKLDDKQKELASIEKKLAVLRKGAAVIVENANNLWVDPVGQLDTNPKQKPFDWASAFELTPAENTALLGLDQINDNRQAAEEAAKKYEEFIIDARLNAMEQGTDEYNALFVARELAKWQDVKGITQEQLNVIQGMTMNGLIDGMEVPAAKTDNLFKGVTEIFTQAVQSEIGGVFSDAIRDDLNTAEDYVSSFASAGANIVGSAFSQAILQSIQGQAVAAGTWGGLGAAAVGLYAVNSVLNSRSEARAEEARRAQLREQLEDELGDSIAQLELDDVGYSIYQLNDRISELTASAMDAGYPMAEIIRLRQLETEEIIKQSRERYDTLSGSMLDWVDDIRTQNYGVGDWMARYNQMAVDLSALDQGSKTYQDDSIEILTDQFDILKKIYDIDSAQLSALTSTSDSLISQVWDLQHSDAMPVSVADYQSQYADLLAGAWAWDTNNDGIWNSGEESIDTDSIKLFQDFVGEYADVMGGLGYDYNDLITTAATDLSALNSAVVSESEMLVQALNLNADMVGLNVDALGLNTNAIIASLNDLIETTENIAENESYTAWRESSVPEYSAVNSGNYTLEHSWPGAQYEPDDMIFRSTLEASGLYGQIIGIADASQSIVAWADNLPDGLSDEMDAWKEEMSNYDPVTGWASFDADSSGWVSYAEYNEGISRLITQYNELVSHIGDIESWPNTISMPEFAMGGLATTKSIFGEAGPEWAVPASGSSYNENFLKSVGMDRVIASTAIDYDKLGQAVAKYLIPALTASGNRPVSVNITDETLARSIQRQLNSNGDFVRSVRSAVFNN